MVSKLRATQVTSTPSRRLDLRVEMTNEPHLACFVVFSVVLTWFGVQVFLYCDVLEYNLYSNIDVFCVLCYTMLLCQYFVRPVIIFA